MTEAEVLREATNLLRIQAMLVILSSFQITLAVAIVVSSLRSFFLALVAGIFFTMGIWTMPIWVIPMAMVQALSVYYNLDQGMVIALFYFGVVHLTILTVLVNSVFFFAGYYQARRKVRT